MIPDTEEPVCGGDSPEGLVRYIQTGIPGIECRSGCEKCSCVQGLSFRMISQQQSVLHLVRLQVSSSAAEVFGSLAAG